MRKTKSRKFKITALVFILAIFAGSFSFCLMSLSTAHASVRMAVSHDGCGDNHFKTVRTGGMGKNSVMPCCMENGSTQKTYTLRNIDSNELKFYPTHNTESLQDIVPFAELQNSSILSFSSSPPGGEKLASIFKKE